MSIETLKKLKADYEETIKKEAPKIAKEFFSEFFEKFPKIEAIRWRQYTPYFNDGESCTFSIHGVYGLPANLSQEDEEKGDYDDGFLNYYDVEKIHPLHKALVALRKLEGDMEEIADVFETVFGDHVEVTVYRDKIEVEEHEHD